METVWADHLRKKTKFINDIFWTKPQYLSDIEQGLG
jgi:hypothetical protein